MKFALVNGNKVEAIRGSKGICQSCGAELIARCGEVNVNHWAHRGSRDCDPWWENETEWHRSWKDSFPQDWQEGVHTDEVSGEKHRADVKTKAGWVLEFQHSYLNPEERRSRNAFYSMLVWVVNGARRKTDKLQFQRILDNECTTVTIDPYIKRVRQLDECRLLQEWSDSNALVFFEIEGMLGTEKCNFWALFTSEYSRNVYLSPISRADFIDLHYSGTFDEYIKSIFSLLRKESDRNKQTQSQNELNRRQTILSETHRRMAWIRRKRRL